MKEEEKQLLLEDLSARLPYEVNIQVYIDGVGYFDEPIWTVDNDGHFHVNDRRIDNIKPYLRPLYSMTEEELEEFRSFHCVYDLHPYFYPTMCNMPNLTNMFNWLNKHHIDYRGLIPKGLALEAPDRMYNIK